MRSSFVFEMEKRRTPQCYIDIQLTSENIHLIYNLSRLEAGIL
jgi:hypothetical protein